MSQRTCPNCGSIMQEDMFQSLGTMAMLGGRWYCPDCGEEQEEW